MSAHRRWAWPLVPLYRAAVTAQEALRNAGLRPEHRLEWPVISVGSLSAGGAGKTPLVIALARLLTQRGWSVDVLSRGYGRSGRGVEEVDAENPGAALRYGDEPTLIAQRAGVPVWVGSNRFLAGAAAERKAAGKLPFGDVEGSANRAREHAGSGTDDDGSGLRQAHLLDDGMQHRALARSFELVLVTAEDLADTLLPAGNLREPLAALRRAHAIAVREEELQVVGARLRGIAGVDVPLWTVRRTLRFPAPLGIFGAGLRPLAFCAIARPEGFAAMLGKAGCGVVDTVVFDDHHRYVDNDITELVKFAIKLGATGLVTTEKDAVKLSAAMLGRLENEVGPVMVVALDATFVYESPVMRLLESYLRPSLPDPEVPDKVGSR